MKCNICNTEKRHKILFVSKFSDKSNIIRCPKCKLTSLHPKPDAKIISNYYHGMYASLVTYNPEIMENANKSMLNYKKNITSINKNANHLLDLGCGLGYYSLAAKHIGYQVTSVEQDKVSVEFAKNTLKLDSIIESNIEEYIYSAKQNFDIIFIRHVIEHVIDPQKLINGISGILKTGGVLVIETDNNKGIELLFRPHSLLFYSKIYKKHYKNVNFFTMLIKRPFAIDNPRHLFAFNIRNLSLLLKKNNLISKKKIHYYTGHPVYWPNLKLPKIRKLFKEFKIKSAVNILAEYTMYPFRRILNHFGMSAGICIYAQKQ